MLKKTASFHVQPLLHALQTVTGLNSLKNFFRRKSKGQNNFEDTNFCSLRRAKANSLNHSLFLVKLIRTS